MRVLALLTLLLNAMAVAGVERSVDLPSNLESLRTVRYLERLTLYVPKAETKFTLPPLDTLVSLMVTGDLRLRQLDGLASQKALQRLYVVGLDPDSRVDFRGITAWPPVQQLTLRRIRVDSAKMLETMKTLERVYLDRVTFDVPVDWSKFPKLTHRSGK